MNQQQRRDPAETARPQLASQWECPEPGSAGMPGVLCRASQLSEDERLAKPCIRLAVQATITVRWSYLYSLQTLCVHNGLASAKHHVSLYQLTSLSISRSLQKWQEATRPPQEGFWCAFFCEATTKDEHK